MYPPLTEDQQILQQGQDPSQEDTSVQPTPEEVQAQQDSQQKLDEEKNDEINRILLELIKLAELEDEDLRYTMLRDCKRNDLYFNDIQKIFYDESAKDVRSLDSVLKDIDKQGLDDIKTVNVYRAFAESLIAAITITAPSVEFTPDDVDNPDDLETAEAYSKISELVSRHNHAGLMLIKAATLQFNCGTIFGYNYYKTDPSYGVVKKPKTITQTPNSVVDLRCKQCGELLDSGLPANTDPNTTRISCPFCGNDSPPNVYGRTEYTDEVTEWENTPKGRSGFDIFSATHVKVSIHARKQEKCGYLILRLEEDIASLKTIYDNFYDDIEAGGGDTTRYERWARIPLQYQGSLPKDITTVRTAWLRPWWFNKLVKEDAEIVLAEYPNGVCATVIGDIIVEKNHEKLDDRWTITFDPRSNFVHSTPPGNALVPMQDSETDMFNLGLQSIEYGIPETFAHPKTLNFKKYKEQRNVPGLITPALPPGPDKGLSDGFHTVKTATLSSEYTGFAQSITSKTQFVTGAFPSIFGGAMQQGSQTATEYTESKSRALQRLQLVWQMISVFWCTLIFKCVRDYADNLIEDEQYSKKQNGTFVNVYIRKSSLEGKAGHVEPEENGQLPQSWAQKKDFFMALLNMQNPEIGPILLHPNNAENIKLITGMPDFYIPGEHDRTKQYVEYYELSQTEPISQDLSQQDPSQTIQQPQDMGQPSQPPQPSVPIDLDVDDHMVHMLVLKNILVSPVGVQLYKTNPAGYQNCIAHYRQHEMAQQAKTISPAGNAPAGQPPQSATSTSQG